MITANWRIWSRTPGQQQRRRRRAVGVDDADAQRAHGHAVLLGWSGDARQCQPDVAAEHAAGALGHLERGLLADHRPVADAEQRRA